MLPSCTITSTSSTTLLYHRVPLAVKLVGAVPLAVNSNGPHKLATKSFAVSPAGAVYKFAVPCSVTALYAAKPASARGVPEPSFKRNSPPFMWLITTRF